MEVARLRCWLARLWLIEDANAVAGVDMLGALLGHLVDGLEGELHVRSIIEIVHRFYISLFWACDATTMHLTVLGSWRTVHFDEDLHIVLLGPVEYFINVWFILIGCHHLHVSVSLPDLFWSPWRDLPTKVDPVPISSRHSDNLDSP